MSVPLAFAFVAVLRKSPEAGPDGRALFFIFLKGLVSFVPGWLLLLIFRDIIGSSLYGFTLYFSLLFRDHLFLFVLAAGAFALWQGRMEYPSTDEGIVLCVLAFLCGFFAPFGLVDFFALYGSLGADSLFLVPLLRLAGILAVAMISPRFYRFQGSYALGFMGAAAAASLVLALISWVFAVNLKVVGMILGAAAFCGSAFAFYFRFPRLRPRPLRR